MLREEGQLRKAGIPWIPFGAQGPVPQGMFWDVPHHAEPKITVAVKTGDTWDGDKLIDTLDSLNLQSYVDWECVVVDETGQKHGKIPGALWAEVISPNGHGELPDLAAHGQRLMWMQAGEVLKHGDLEKVIA